MRYTCEFEHKDTGEFKTVVVALSAEEVRSVESLTDHADLHAQAYVLRHAYAEVPKGFLHSRPPELIRPS
jgi:hypothetical protein